MACTKKEFNIDDATELFEEIEELYQIFQNNYSDKKKFNKNIVEALRDKIKKTGSEDFLREFNEIFDSNIKCEIENVLEPGEQGAISDQVDFVFSKINKFWKTIDSIKIKFEIKGSVGISFGYGQENN
jgi:glutathionyl-hydroquinone reductase